MIEREILETTKLNQEVKKFINNQEIKKSIFVPNRLINIII
jgi:leucyl-tRNA synthetase